MYIIRKILFALGISLLLGVITGYITSQQKYYYLSLDGPKREITKGIYDEIKNSYSHGYFKKESAYNFKMANIIGLSIFGIFLVFISLINPKSKENDNIKTYKN